MEPLTVSVLCLVAGVVFGGLCATTPTLLAFAALALGWYFTRRHAQITMGVLAASAMEWRQLAMNKLDEIAHYGGPPPCGHFPSNGDGDDDEEGSRAG